MLADLDVVTANVRFVPRLDALIRLQRKRSLGSEKSTPANDRSGDVGSKAAKSAPQLQAFAASATAAAAQGGFVPILTSSSAMRRMAVFSGSPIFDQRGEGFGDAIILLVGIADTLNDDANREIAG